jgi:dinuclear metal center YbgI/SA1388 family protein
MQREHLVDILNNHLTPDSISDTSWNGLQLAGSEEVSKIGLAVDSGQEIFLEAQARQIDFLITHHGLFWKHTNPSLVAWQMARIQSLLTSNTSLYCSHLPLDSHPENGNNVQLIKLLGASPTQAFSDHQGTLIGWLGEFSQTTSLTDITRHLNQELDTNCHVLNHGPHNIKRIAVLSGGGSYQGFYDALNHQADLYLTGDTAELYQVSKDAKINIIFAGHYATETLGLKSLGDYLHKKTDLEVDFIDQPTGL